MKGHAGRVYIVQSILGRIKYGISEDDARVLRSFAEDPLDEVMPPIDLALAVLDRELKRVRAEVPEKAP